MYCFILMGSLFGNIFIIIIVYEHRDLHKAINYFIVNMAVSDLLFPLIVVPVNITGLATDSWHWRVSGILGSCFCKLFYFSSSVALHVSVQSLVWIAIDRFVAVVFPIKLGLISPKIRTTAIISSWIIAGLFNSPSLIISDVVVHDNTDKRVLQLYRRLSLQLRCFGGIFVSTITFTFYRPVSWHNGFVHCDSNRFKKEEQNPQWHRIKSTLKPFWKETKTSYSNGCYHRGAVLYSRYSIDIVIFRPLLESVLCLSKSVLESNELSVLFVNPIVCLSFVERYRRGLRNILCPCTKTPDSLTVKLEQVLNSKRGEKSFRRKLSTS